METPADNQKPVQKNSAIPTQTQGTQKNTPAAGQTQQKLPNFPSSTMCMDSVERIPLFPKSVMACESFDSKSGKKKNK